MCDFNPWEYPERPLDEPDEQVRHEENEDEQYTNFKDRKVLNG
jgi:hypothetical protein